MRGMIDKVWDNETEDGRRYLVLDIDGERYSLWNQSYFDYVQEGQMVDYRWNRNGRFRNITDLQILGDVYGEEAPDDGFLTDKDRRIIRMACLKYSTHVLSGRELEPTELPAYVIGLAEDMERYVMELRATDESQKRSSSS